MDPRRQPPRAAQPANPQADLGSRRQGRLASLGKSDDNLINGFGSTMAHPTALRRPRPHAVLRSQMRHHQTYVLKADIRRDRFLDVLQPLDSLLQASRLN